MLESRESVQAAHGYSAPLIQRAVSPRAPSLGTVTELWGMHHATLILTGGAISLGRPGRVSGEDAVA